MNAQAIVVSHDRVKVILPQGKDTYHGLHNGREYATRGRRHLEVGETVVVHLTASTGQNNPIVRVVGRA